MINCSGCKYLEALSHPNAYCYMHKQLPLTCNHYVPPIKQQNTHIEPHKSIDMESLLAAMFK